jgi:hypothetical protein
MKRFSILMASLCLAAATASATPRIDEQSFGDKLGGWTKRSNQAAEYPLSGSSYRTYKPEVSPTPDGGIFVSLRIDHMRGMLASDDHAVLELTVSDKGNIVTAQSNIAIQGRAITSDLIRGGSDASKKFSGVDHAVQIGTDLVADLSEKLLREKIVEAGRVSFPAALRHNYNLLYQAIRTEDPPKPEAAAATSVEPGATPPPAPPEVKVQAPRQEPRPDSAKLEIKTAGDKPQVDLPVKK